MIANQAPALLATPAKNADPRECPICGAPDPVKWLTAPDHFHGRPRLYQLLRCSACSMVWLDDPPSKAEMGMHYGPDYDRTISTAARAPSHWFERRDEILRLKPGGGAILDLGCATGGFLSTLQGPAWRLFGIEMSEDAAIEARKRCGAEVFVGDIVDADFPPASFDAITCFNVFEHVYEPKEVLVRVAKWLKPGGIFYTLMPNIDSAGARIFRSYWYALELPRHLYHFSPATLRRVAHSAGLREVSLETRRELFFEFSTRFLFDDFVKKFGIHRPPLAGSADEGGLAWRVVRKIYRLTLLQLFTAAASLAGPGETIAAVFTKDGAPRGVFRLS
jgi:SAM-dependent methyltransferase